MPGWRVVVTLHTGPGMGLLGARVQLAVENPRGPLGEDRAKSSTRVKREIERDANPRDETQLVLLLLRFPEASSGRSEQLSK